MFNIRDDSAVKTKRVHVSLPTNFQCIQQIKPLRCCPQTLAFPFALTRIIPSTSGKADQSNSTEGVTLASSVRGIVADARLEKKNYPMKSVAATRSSPLTHWLRIIPAIGTNWDNSCKLKFKKKRFHSLHDIRKILVKPAEPKCLTLVWELKLKTRTYTSTVSTTLSTIRDEETNHKSEEEGNSSLFRR